MRKGMPSQYQAGQAVGRVIDGQAEPRA